MKLHARVAGVGLVGPGLPSWNDARAILAGRAPFVRSPTLVPAADALPPTERRRAGKSVRLALGTGLAAANDAGCPARDLAAVFASSSGDGENCHAICEALASSDRLISPTRFHNSVHNAPAGYWGIATGSMHAADCLAAFDSSFAAGLLEAMARLAARPSKPVLLVAYDAPYPEPLHGARRIADAFAVAFVLAPAGPPGDAATITVDSVAGETPTALDDGNLEDVRRGIPSARGLPLLALLARGGPGRVRLDYLDGLGLSIEVSA